MSAENRKHRIATHRVCGHRAISLTGRSVIGHDRAGFCRGCLGRIKGMHNGSLEPDEHLLERWRGYQRALGASVARGERPMPRGGMTETAWESCEGFDAIEPYSDAEYTGL